jgi:hypothetical protein
VEQIAYTVLLWFVVWAMLRLREILIKASPRMAREELEELLAA